MIMLQPDGMQYPPSTDDPKTAPVLVIDGVPRGLLLSRDPKAKKGKSDKNDKKDGAESKADDGKSAGKDKSRSTVSLDEFNKRIDRSAD
jgi:hypothetical protein